MGFPRKSFQPPIKEENENKKNEKAESGKKHTP